MPRTVNDDAIDSLADVLAQAKADRLAIYEQCLSIQQRIEALGRAFERGASSQVTGDIGLAITAIYTSDVASSLGANMGLLLVAVRDYIEAERPE